MMVSVGSFVPLGGATGLIAGVALAVKTLRPSCKVRDCESPPKWGCSELQWAPAACLDGLLDDLANMQVMASGDRRGAHALQELPGTSGASHDSVVYNRGSWKLLQWVTTRDSPSPWPGVSISRRHSTMASPSQPTSAAP